MRKVPATMATQHPDNAGAPYWKKDAFVNAVEELEEAILSYRDLGCEEYMWDWEGKYVDEGIVDKLLKEYYDYFKRDSLGRERFLTLRIPRMDDRSSYPRVARAFMTMMTAQDVAMELGMHSQPVFEIILPFTQDARTLILLQRKFRQAIGYKQKVFPSGAAHAHIETIPLIEGVDTLVDSRKLLADYVKRHRQAFGKKPERVRPFIARSDPALNAGLVPATVSAKAALSEYCRFEEESGVPTHPLLGAGSTVFRGGLRPDKLKRFRKEYEGVKTVTLQSAFRYDFPRSRVKAAVRELNHGLRKGHPCDFDRQALKAAKEINRVFSKPYVKTVLGVAGDIIRLGRHVPPRRERLTNTERFGYGRKMGKNLLPRVIAFCCALYSVGVPAELIGTGRGLVTAKKTGLLESVEANYANLGKDLADAGALLNRENLAALAKRNTAWRAVQEDVAGIEEVLGLRLGPRTDAEYMHRNHASNVYLLWRKGNDIRGEVERAAELRKALG